MARPEKPIDWDLVDQLLIAGCCGAEVASHFSIHPSTFYDKIAAKYETSFTNYAQNLKQKGESLLRHKQFCKAMGYCQDGDNTMLIWLGKNRMKQSESPHELNISEQTMTQFNSLMSQITEAQSARKIEEIKINEEQKS